MLPLSLHFPYPTKEAYLKKFTLISLNMSTTYLVLLFLCITLHACNARHLILNPLDKKLEKKQHLSNKNDVENGFKSTQKKLNEGNDDKRNIQSVVDSEKPKNRRSNNKRVLKAVGKASMAYKMESLVSVSWRVPHKKRSQKHHPGFNLDYSPPKTHPPSHN